MPLNWSDFEADSEIETVLLELGIRQQSLALSAIQYIQNPVVWGNPDDATWDEIDQSLGELAYDIMEQQTAMSANIGCTAYRTTVFTSPNTAGFNPIALTDQIDDTGSFWDISQPSRLTIPETGIYLFGGQLSWTPNATGDTALRAAGIRLNGTNLLAVETGVMVNQTISLNMVMRLGLTTGSYIELVGWSQIASHQAVATEGFRPTIWIAQLET